MIAEGEGSASWGRWRHVGGQGGGEEVNGRVEERRRSAALLDSIE